MANVVQKSTILIIRPGTGETMDYAIEDSRINQDIDSKGYEDNMLYLPAGIDLHVHFREPGFEHKETMESGMLAANAGGISTVMDMPNNNPVIDTLAALHQKVELASRFEGIFLASAVTNHSAQSGELVRMAEKSRFLKVFLANSTGNLMIEENFLKKALDQLQKEKVNSMVFFHAEDPSLVRNRQVNSYELEVRPIDAEIRSIKYVLELQSDYPDQKMHVTHVSTLDGAKLLKKQQTVTWDILPKYLEFSTDLVDDKGNYAKMNPPLRTKRDVTGLREMLFKGGIPMLTSDHAPHTHLEKNQDKVVAGAPGVQETYPFLIDLYLRSLISKEVMLQVIYEQPKQILRSLGLQPVEKTVSVDPNQTTQFTPEFVVSACGWSLWEGKILKGKIIS